MSDTVSVYVERGKVKEILKLQGWRGGTTPW
jgi:hypothetical protein